MGDAHPPNQRRETSVGSHYLGCFQDCKRRWYLTYACGLQGEGKPPALGFGSAIHFGYEGYYKSARDPEELIASFKLGMEVEKPTYGKPDQWDMDLTKGFNMLSTWVNTWHKADLERYEVREVEVEYSIPIPDTPYALTIRPDLVMYDKSTGEHYLFDHKTTSWSVGQAYSQVEAQDQATAYIWGMRKAHPDWRVQGLIPDVLYAKGSVYKAERPGVVYRTEADLQEWEYEASGILSDITQRMEASLEGGYPIRHLFPRNGSYCARYSCAFDTICRTNVTPKDVPIGFSRREDATSEDPD